MRNSNPKGAARVAVEAALAQATFERPLSAYQIAEMAGVSVSLARTHIANCVNIFQAYNINGETRGAPGLYVAGRCPVPERPHVAQSRANIPTGQFTGTRWTIRENGEAHKSLGSRRGEEVVPWTTPMLIGGRLVNNDKWAQQ